MRIRYRHMAAWGLTALLAVMGSLVRGAGTGTVAVATAGAESNEVAVLQRQVEYLSRALAEARAEEDALKAAVARQAFDGGEGNAGSDADAVMQALAAGVNVVHVNRDLRMVVLGAGRRHGMTPGLVFAVIHGERAVARVRVVDVRRTIAGAVIEKLTFGAYPVVGDRVLMENTR